MHSEFDWFALRSALTVELYLPVCPGDQPFPCLAAYGASKAALNLFLNTLRHELEPWGVRVSTILPSSYKTGEHRTTYRTDPHLSVLSVSHVCHGVGWKH